MAKVTITADLCSRTYTGTANRYYGPSSPDGIAAATHGYYGSNGNWVGMVVVPHSLAGKRITGITMHLHARNAGSTSNKTVYLYSSNYQTINASGTGSIFPKNQLGTISGSFYNSYHDIGLTGSLLANLGSYLSAGNQMIILYDPYGSTANYCRFDAVSLDITFEEPYDTVKYRHNGEWVSCRVFRKQNGYWIPCQVFYRKNGMYNPSSHG